ncbi:MAG: prephenate dehydrogenase/arogenate dehydrogenase family protein [archaeon]
MAKGKMLIIGGSGAFGSFYANLFKEDGFEVSIFTRDIDSLKGFCEKNSYSLTNNLEEVKNFDYVIISVPNEIAPKVVKEIAPKLKKGALIFDFCSVKDSIVKELKKLENKDIEIASIHPMHGPRVQSIAGYSVVCIPIKGGKKLEVISESFRSRKANFFNSTAKEHDTILSIVQGLTHYSQFVSAEVLNALEADLKKTMRFSTPNYSLYLSLISRVVLQNPQLYSEIQVSNPSNEKMRELFTKSAVKLEKICKAKNSSEKLEKRLIEDSKIFKDPDVMLLDSDRAVNALKLEVNILMNNIGHKFLVENMITHSFHYGTIKSVDDKEIVIDEGHEEKRLSLSRIRITTKKEMNDWKKKNLQKIALDFSFLTPSAASAEIVAKCISRMLRSDVEIIDQFYGQKLPTGTKSITIRVAFYDGDTKKEDEEEVKKVLLGMGYSLR